MLNKKPIDLLTIVIISFALLVFCGQAYGAEKITGAFGMKLGDIFNPSSAIGRGELTDGTPMYQFHPKQQFRLFGSVK